MKLGTQTRAAAFLVYEYKHHKRLGAIIKLDDQDELRYIVFEDAENKGHSITAIYTEINFKIFHSSNNLVENLDEKWREFNLEHNPEVYSEHCRKLLEIQKPHFNKGGSNIPLYISEDEN